ncbi:MAG TPA: hypothetical protein VGS79_00300 [Puia sp.]|nr:hypothetical protein [Puia sp.]
MRHKNLLLIFVIALIVVPCAGQDFVRMENIGPNVKYLNILFVSNGNVTDTNQLPTVMVSLDSTSFEKFRGEVIRHLPNVQDVQHPAFGCFEIEIKNDGRLTNRYLLNSDISVPFFKKLLFSFKGSRLDKRIMETVDMYIKQLGG